VAARDAGTATTQAPAVLLAKKSTFPPARDATASWSADDEAALLHSLEEMREKEEKTPPFVRPFVTATYLFANIHTFTASKDNRRRAKLVNWRATLRPNPRLHFVVFVSSSHIHVFP